MDKDNVILTIESANWESGDKRPDPVRLTTEGRMERLDDAWQLLYRESADSGMEGTLTRICVFDDGSVSLMRGGVAEMQLVFQEGQQHLTQMTTPFGVLHVGLLTHTVQTALTCQGGTVALSYTIDFGNRQLVHTAIHIAVRARGAPTGDVG